MKILKHLLITIILILVTSFIGIWTVTVATLGVWIIWLGLGELIIGLMWFRLALRKHRYKMRIEKEKHLSELKKFGPQWEHLRVEEEDNE